MKIPEALRSALACAPPSRSSFTVVVEGRSYQVSQVSQSDARSAPEQDQDFELRYALERFITRVADDLADLSSSIEQLREAQLEIVKELRKPVIPQYDPQTGRLIAAQRR